MEISDSTCNKILTVFYTALFILMISALMGGCSYTIKQGDPVRVEKK